MFRSKMCNMTGKEKLRLAAQDVRFSRPAAGYRLFQEVIYDTGEVAIGVGTVQYVLRNMDGDGNLGSKEWEIIN